MEGKLKLDYFYGDEPEKFCFYRIPKVLFTKAYFENLSTDAKVLYGLMLDMMSSSRSNRWLDKENRVFIQFSIQRAMAYLQCGKDKAIKLFAELDTEKGIGLIERIDRGQGKADLIYVKSFEISQDAEDNARIKKLKKKQMDTTFGPSVQKSGVDNSSEVVDFSDHSEKSDWNSINGVVGNIDQSGNPTTLPIEKVVGKTDRSEKSTSRGRKNRPQEVGKSDLNNTYYNNTDFRDYSPVPSCHNERKEDRINRMDFTKPIRLTYGKPLSDRQDGQDRRDIRDAYTDMLRRQVCYNMLMELPPYCYSMDTVDGIINIIVDIATTISTDGREWVNGRAYPHEIVKSRLLKTDYEIITHVLDRMSETSTQIRNMRSYLITALYNARDELNLAIQSQVNYNLYNEQRGV